MNCKLNFSNIFNRLKLNSNIWFNIKFFANICIVIKNFILDIDNFSVF